MYILIAGGGTVGRRITRELSKSHDVVVIDLDFKICEKISTKYGAVAINGDATKIATLLDAGVEKCDYALGVMDNDSQNLLFSLLCKNFKVKDIFVRMKNPEYRTAYELAGATNIGHSVQMMVSKFVLDIENPAIRRVVSIGNGKAEVSIITLKEHSKVIGQTVADITKNKAFPDNVVIAGMFDLVKDEFIVPRGNTRFKVNNQIFLVGSQESILNAYKILIKK